MNSPSRAWQAIYVSAVLETDPDKALTRITEAQEAIANRLLESSVSDGAEHHAIKAAWKALVNLRTTRYGQKAHQPAA